MSCMKYITIHYTVHLVNTVKNQVTSIFKNQNKLSNTQKYYTLTIILLIFFILMYMTSDLRVRTSF